MTIDPKLLEKIGYFLFLIGIFILPTMFVFAAICLLLAGIIGSFINKQNYFNNNWNKSFFICGLLILTSILTHVFNSSTPYRDVLDANLSIAGSFNWLPFFWLFWALQPYIDSSEKRKRTAFLLIAGTFPVLISGFSQYFFNLTGPFEALNGLIVWYQRPLGKHGLTGPFNNQNYAGAWFSLVWPFSIAFLIEKTKSSYKKSASIFFFLTIGLASILTNSRNAWLSILLTLPLVLNISNLYWLLTIVFFISLLITITSSDLFNGELQETFRNIIPDKIWMEFTKKSRLTRLDIYLSTLKISLIEPLFGIGGGSFPIIYELQNNIWRGHPHNLILELAVSYGYPVTILIFLTISNLLIKSSKLVFNKKSQNNKYFSFEKAWWTSIFIFLISQLVDVQYFDGRISIVFWILLAGLKTIIDDSFEKV
jgi:O-antigen ligase